MLNTPILLILFNRPGHTEQVFREIRYQKPRFLYVAADGPREGYPADILLCNDSRNIINNIDWDCQVKTLFNDQNLGCGLGPATAISWFFSQVEDGIVLEDDCVPNNSFFQYCEVLLDKYRYHTEVMMICGTSYQPKPLGLDSYYFSKYAHVWGWATWKRAWSFYNYDIRDESEMARKAIIGKTFRNTRERRLWENNLRMIVNGLDAWDYQWMYWIWRNGGACIVPWKNMISNTGFGPNATHTFDAASDQSQMEQYEINSMIHPINTNVNETADRTERYKILILPFFKLLTQRIASRYKTALKILAPKKVGL